MDTSQKIPDESLTKKAESMDDAIIVTAVLFICYLGFAVLYALVKCCQHFYNI